MRRFVSCAANAITPRDTSSPQGTPTSPETLVSHDKLVSHDTSSSQGTTTSHDTTVSQSATTLRDTTSPRDTTSSHNTIIHTVNDGIILTEFTDALRFGTDALLLADFVTARHPYKKYASAADLGTGSGAIALILAKRAKINLIHAIEIQRDLAEQAKLNAEANALSDSVNVICADLRDRAAINLPAHSLDAVFTNPPYVKYDKNAGGAGVLPESNLKALARREITCSPDDIASCAAHLLKNGGAFYAIYRPDRLQPLFTALTNANLTPKHLTFVFADSKQNASLVLIEAKQGAKEGMTISREQLTTNS